jgi:hypothetical protein
MRWLQRLLYVASLLFVSGIMMSRSNFTWILTHWHPTDEDVSKTLEEVTHAGVAAVGSRL